MSIVAQTGPREIVAKPSTTDILDVELISGGLVDCRIVEFVGACISLWPGQELTVEIPAGVDEADLSDAFRACGCTVKTDVASSPLPTAA